MRARFMNALAQGEIYDFVKRWHTHFFIQPRIIMNFAWLPACRIPAESQ